MAASSQARNTKRLGDNVAPADFWIKANTKVNAGTIACLDADGLLVPGSTSATLKAVGRARDTYDNTGGPTKAFQCAVESGVFLYYNEATDLCTIADITNDCYIVDDQTVAKTDGTASRSKAGKIINVVAAGVWVEIRHVS
jgi:hypothetical protein